MQKNEPYYLNMLNTRQIILADVPEEYRSYAVCLAGVSANDLDYDSYALQYVPEEHKTYALCLTAVQYNGWALNFVPAEHQSYELCLAAVGQYGMALQYVPAKHQKEELLLAAMHAQTGESYLLLVAEELRTPAVCLAAIKHDALQIAFIPESLKTQEFYEQAASVNGWIISKMYEDRQYISDFHALYLAAISHDGNVLRAIPPKNITYKLCLAAVKQKKKALRHVPEQFRTPELLALAAVDNIKRSPENDKR